MFKSIFSPTRTNLVIFQIIAHLALVYLIFNGTAFQWLITGVLYMIGVTFSGTVILHRLLSHRSFESPKWFTTLGVIVTTVCYSIPVILWVATHREHHRYTDEPKDPHSPKYMGLLSVQFLPVGRLLSGKGMFEKPNIGYATDFLRSKFHLTLFNYFWLFNIMFSVVLYLIDPMAVLYAWLVPAVLVWHGGASINSLGHSKFGYRNYSTNDNSTNNIITGFLVGGEGWHNNHHAQPANPKFGHKWWEFDLGWQIIKLVRLDKK